MELFKKEESAKKKMSVEDVKAKIREWGEFFEVFHDDKDVDDLQKILHFPIIKEKLVLNESDKSFTYILKDSIKDRDTGSEIHSSVKIIDCDMTAKKGIQKIKNKEEKGEATMKAYVFDSEGQDIPIGFISRIKTGDEILITSLLTSFFAGAI